MRTPLAAIKGFAETLRCGGLEDEENRLDFVETIERHAQRLSLLVEDMLLISDLDSRAKPPAFETIDLAGFVSECVTGLAPLIKAGGAPLAFDVPGGLRVRVDADRMTRVFQNLLDNAFKYNRRGGRVILTARADGTEAVVTVRDTGLGMPEGDLSRIFDRFYRSRATKHIHGTGLGLAIVKAIVELHGGRIWVESVVGKGSAFHFTLPLAT
jgi:two-component system phosphate regulon sensor histidine kinase PhoR